MMYEEPTVDFKNIKAVVGDIKVSGLAQTKEEYIKNQFQKIFDIHNFQELVVETDELRRRLLSLGIFKNVDALVDKSKRTKPNTYDILIHVEEKSPIGGGFHTAVGNNDGSINTNISCPNVFGKGERLGCEYSYGTNNHIDYRLYYSSPVEMDPSKPFTVSGFRSCNDFPWSKYKQYDSGVSFDIAAPFNWLIRDKYTVSGKHSLSYESVWRQIVSSLDTTFEVREQSGHSLKSAVKYTNIIDERDHPILPRSGAYLKSTLELAGLGGDVKFVKANADYQVSKTFFEHFITQFTFSKGLVLPLSRGNSVQITDKMFLGGPLTLRGFTNRGAGYQKEECALGGNAYWLMGLHLYTPLPFLHRHKSLSSWLKTHSFLNMGNIASLNDSDVKKNLLENTRLSVGSGIVIGFGGMARLELNYVYPLWKSQYDKSVTGLQFGVGIVFN